MIETGFLRRQLGYRLHRMRQAAGLSRRAVVQEEIVGSTRILMRLETGMRTTVRYPIVNSLCRLYGTDTAMRKETERMFRQLELPEWHESPENWSNDTALLLDLEPRASRFLIHEPTRIHGLLQTTDYMLKGAYALHDVERLRVEHTVEQRRHRQEQVWKNRSTAEMKVVFGRDSVRSMEGTDQLSALREYARKPAVSIRFRTKWSFFGNYDYPFSVLAFDEDQHGCAYTETISSHRYESQPRAVAAYTDYFESLYEQATPIEEIDDADLYLA